MIDASAIKQIQDSVQTIDFIDNETRYTSKPVHRLPEEPEHMPATLAFTTLNAVTEYVARFTKGNFDFYDKHTNELAIHIVSPVLVRVIARLTPLHLKRPVYVEASTHHIYTSGFKFGQYYDVEDFIVALMTLFVDTPDRKYVLDLVSNIRDKDVLNAIDNGVTQTVKTRKGISTLQDEPVRNPVHMAPYRTFREVPQPVSAFLLRMRSGKELPECALFEADGGTWNLEAMKNIHGFFTQTLTDSDLLILS